MLKAHSRKLKGKARITAGNALRCGPSATFMVNEWRVPEWEEYLHTPGVFVRVAFKGLRVYGTWKSVRRMECGKIRG
jgi:hypothetical protein